MAEDADSLDPQRAGAPSSFGLARALHRGLMAFPPLAGADGARPVPDLAAAMPEVTADGLRYTFTLREGVAFGPPASRPIVAADVKAGLDRLPSTGSPLARYYRVIAGVAAPDQRTVVVMLVRPSNDLLSLLALPAASAVPAGLARTAKAGDISPSGPYRLAPGGYEPERSIRLVRNPAWKGSADPVRQAWVDEIRVSIGLSQTEMVRRISDGEADLQGDGFDPSVALTGISRDRVVTASNGCLRYVFMNTRVPPFSSGRVRVAVSRAIDRAEATAVYGPGAAPAATILPPTVDGHDPDRPVPAADPRAARAALTAAGHASGFATSLVTGDLPADRRQATEIAADLRRAGVRASISVVPVASVYEDRYEVPSARVPMGIATWCADWPGPAGRSAMAPLLDGRSITPRGNTNYSGVNDPAQNRAMDAAAAQRVPPVAAGAWLVADARAQNFAAVVPLAHLHEVSLLGGRVRGFVAHPYFVRGDLTAVWLAPA